VPRSRTSVYLWSLTLGGFRRRTPDPPPFSSMNSMLAAPKSAAVDWHQRMLVKRTNTLEFNLRSLRRSVCRRVWRGCARTRP
jgi:hypothetical protein